MLAFSTTKTKAVHKMPNIITVNFINFSAFLALNGFFRKGLIKSSKTTAVIEFKPVDRELQKKDRKFIFNS